MQEPLSHPNAPRDDADWSAFEDGDPRRAYDRLRDRCPVAQRPLDGTWMITGHAEVVASALDAQAFSNRVSSRLQIPNGLDGDEHRRFRSLIDRFFTPARIEALEGRFLEIAEDLAAALPRQTPVDAVWQVGAPLAVRFQCAWLGWSPDAEATLLQWVREYRAAMGDNQPARRAAVAEHFDAIVLEQLRQRAPLASRCATDVTSELLMATVEDPRAPGGQRELSESEVLSILRNWTAGDLGTIAACIGIVAHRVVTDVGLQSSLRTHVDDALLLDRAIDECLRIDDPFLWNRRVATRDVEIAGCVIPAGAKVILHWTAANRDPRRFQEPDAFRPEENALHNLVYGIGAHVCPGRQLATLQLRCALGSLLRGTSGMELAQRLPLRANGQAGGFEHVWMTLAE